MQFSPEQIEGIMERTAKELADRIEERLGGISAMIVMDMRTTARLVGLSTKQIPVYLPTVEISAGKHGVTLAAIEKHILSNTRPPAGVNRKKAREVAAA